MTRIDARTWLVPAAVAATALVVSCLVLVAARVNPIDALGALAQGAAGDRFAIADTLIKTCPLVLTGLAVAGPVTRPERPRAVSLVGAAA